MATTRPFAYNSGSTISGTDQVGSLAIGVTSQDYSLNPGGVKWWMGPNEDLGYVIAHPTVPPTQPTEIPGVTAGVGFWRSSSLTDQSFINLCNVIPPREGLTPFTTTSACYSWLNSNGYWTSYPSPTPTPTSTPTTSVTPTVTLTPTTTVTSTVTQTPTSTPLLTSASYLAVGGGAGGGANWGGGGGAGQVVSGTTNLSKAQTYTITIGNGGNGATSGGQGTNGGTTTFSGTGLSVTAVGGGGGGYNITFSSASNGSSGASGGGGGGGGTSRSTGGSATAGFSGGSVTVDNSGAGGGGGSSQAGANGTFTTVSVGGNGGSGTTSNITGSAVVYAGGGGGGSASTAGVGGAGGGGNGASASGGAGSNATGYGCGGGGGATNGGNGGNGSAGVVILSVPTNQLGTYTGTPIVTTNGVNTVLTFTGNGSYTATSIAPTPTPTVTQTSTPTPSITPTSTPNSQGFSYSNFASTTGLVGVGNTSVSSNIYYLTTATGGQVGNVYRTTAIQFNRNFSTTWSTFIGGGTGADGYCIQWTPTNNTNGPTGGGVGLLSTAINAITFLTFTNNNYTWYKNNVSQGSTSVTSGFWRQTLYFWGDYNHSAQTFALYWNTTNSKPGSPNKTFTSFSFDTGSYYMGFGAATGGSTDNHELLSWTLQFT